MSAKSSRTAWPYRAASPAYTQEASSPGDCGTAWPVRRQYACTASFMLSGARKEGSSTSISAGKGPASSASSDRRANVISSPSSARIDWIIHRPMMFFR